MRSFTVLFVVAFGAHSCIGDRLENIYLPPNSAQTAGGHSAFLTTPKFEQNANLGKNYLPPNRGYLAPSKFVQSGYPVASYQAGYKSPNQNIPIVKFSNNNDGKGNYAYGYETGNGIKVQEVGKNQGGSEAVQGSYSYTGPDGHEYSVWYVADKNGFRAVGDHLPTPPPVTEPITPSIHKNEKATANGYVYGGSQKGETGLYTKIIYNSGYRY